MTDGSGSSVLRTADLEAELLEAKLSVPSLRPGAVSRAGLIERARNSERRVVGITAPAGYGKSTLLAEWAESDDRRVAFVSLGRSDDDPSAFLGLLASAYSRVSDNGQLSAEISGPGVSPLGRGAPRLASAFHTSPAPFVLMIDDLQELRSPACHDVLGVVISGIPPGSQVVTASRSEQPHLPRLRVQADTVEFAAHDLALDSAAAEQIFARAHLDITAESAEAVTAKTEGWPVGLHLAALIAVDSGDVLAISGDDRFVADYLYHESLMQLPEDVQRFLRRTAVLDQMCAPLCDTVLEEPGAQARLRVLEATNMFLVPLDRRRQWYRYHALFREFLLSELGRTEPDMIAKVHLRAADWYEANGSPALALEHLLNTTEHDRCAQAMAKLLMPTHQSGHFSTAQRWLSTLGPAVVEGYPPLAALAGWAAVLSGQTAEAERWADFLDEASFDHATLDGTASFASSRALYRALICREGPQQMASSAHLAATEEPPWSRWRAAALHLEAEAQMLLGEEGSAADLLVETSAVAAELGNVNSLILSNAELAMLAMDRGQWVEADEHVHAALVPIQRLSLDDYIFSPSAFAAAARLAVHRGDLNEAKRQLTRAMRARPSSTFVIPWNAVRLRLNLATLYAALAEEATARHLLNEIDDILYHRPALGVLVEDVSAFRRRLTSSTRVMAGAPPLTAAELRLLPYLQTHLTFRDIGSRLFVSRNTVSTQVGSIYRKLGVTSRSEAVERAIAHGMLGG